MSFSRALDHLPSPVLTSSERLKQAVEMYDEGVALQLNNLRRRHPGLNDAELQALLHRWLCREGED